MLLLQDVQGNDVSRERNQSSQLKWLGICDVDDLSPNAGICALVADRQVAIFYFPDTGDIYALDNYDPFGHANVIFRGITGDINGQAVVASPLYKQHFILESGQCVEDESVQLTHYPVHIVGDTVEIAVPAHN
ncbi:MAG TPA: nitrite reductase small subunit NirD [Crenotrichaceae bacterium]|nr:nitrite reductase small subunit NirD [Crenotrichaceae bacterium]